MHTDIMDPPVGAMVGLKVIFLNGPPRSGKDTAGKAIRKRFPDAEIAKFAGPLKRMTYAMYNLPHDLDPEYFDATKGDLRLEFYGKTPRNSYIFTSEEIIKPFFGPDFFGKLLLRTLWRRYLAGYRLVAVTDFGFAPEAVPVIETVGPEKCLLMRVRGEGRGTTFEGDSRSYIELPIRTVEVVNDAEGEQTAFEFAVVKSVCEWLKE